MNPPASTPSDTPPPGLSLRNSDVALWRESLTHLRHLGDDVWTGLRTFLGGNALIVAAIGVLISFSRSKTTGAVLVGILSITGILLTLIARYILKRHRIYYLQMLAKKSLLEEDLGFYRTKFAGSQIDLAFPWRLSPEVIAEIRTNIDAWVNKSIRGPGTIAKFQFLLYESLIALYGVALLAAIIAMFG